ncbi:MAG: hypothetical protein ACM34J_08280 [Ignavibacteria bacterium]
MILRKIQTPLYLITSIAAILHLLSCNLFTEPEPYENKDAHPPTVKYKTATLLNYSQDQVVTGSIELQFLPDFEPEFVENITVFVDSTEAGPLLPYYTYSNRPQLIKFQISIDTKRWSNGKHNIYFYVYKKATYSDSLGTLGLLYTPLEIYKTTLIFDGNSLPVHYEVLDFVDDIDNSVLFIEKFLRDEMLLESFSTQNCSLLSMKHLYANGTFVKSKSLDGKRLIILIKKPSPGSVIVKIDRLPFDDFSYPSINYDATNPKDDVYGFAVGTNDILYYSDIHGNLSISTSSGNYLASYNIFDGPARYLTISPDGSKMLGVDNIGIKNYFLRRDSAIFSLQSSVFDKIGLFYPDWKNSRIFITRQNTILEEWDIQSLNPNGAFQIPDSMQVANNITAIRANSRFLYAAYTLQENENDSSLVVEYEIASQKVSRFWNYKYLVQSLAGSENGRYLFVGTSYAQWFIDLGGNL